MKVSKVILILCGIIPILYACGNPEVSSLDKHELEKVAKTYLHSDDTTKDGQIRPKIESIHSIPHTDRKILLFRDTSCSKCYGFTQVEKKRNHKYQFIGGADISNGPITDGIITIDGKTFYVMVVDNKQEKIYKVVNKQKGVLYHSFKPGKNLSVTLNEVSEKTYNKLNYSDSNLTFYDKDNKDITKRVWHDSPNSAWIGVGK